MQYAHMCGFRGWNPQTGIFRAAWRDKITSVICHPRSRVCGGVGVGHAQLPDLALGTGRLGAAEAAASHAILSLFAMQVDQWSPET